MENIILGKSEIKLKELKNDSIDLIITSPPYADRRKNTYGGIHEKNYVNWFKPIAFEIKRILKPTGSFFLNIKPHTKNGERSLYVFDLIFMLKKDINFLFVDEFCWIKNPFPTGNYGRFKNGFEPVYHFTKEKPNKIKFNPLACGTSISDSNISRSFRKNNKIPKNGSGMVVDKNNFKTLKIARPSNVIKANNVVNQFTLKMKHSAVFPEKLVEFFVKSFSNENDIILDPFAGSGTVGIVCEENNRKYILIDKEKDNIDLIIKRINSLKIKKD